MFSFKRQVGNQAEAVALEHLWKHGLELIEQNYLTKMGEIDIIMLDKSEQTLVFVEVRYRQNTQFGSATDSVNHNKPNWFAPHSITYNNVLSIKNLSVGLMLSVSNLI